MRHLEEGEIHAWLDGAMPPDEAARTDAHVAGCSRCAAEVATARGLIAGASRILLALDSIPGGVIPGRSGQPLPAEPGGTAPPPVAGDVLALRHTKATERRHVPWFSRPFTRIAAGLALAVGLGAVAARDDGDQSTQLTVELRTEPASSPGLSDSLGAAPTSMPSAEAAQGVPATAPAPAALRQTAKAHASAGSAGAIGAVRGAPPAPPVPAAVQEQTVTPSPPPTVVRSPAPAVDVASGAASSAGAAGATPQARVRRDSTMGQTLRLESVVTSGVTEPIAGRRLGFAASTARDPLPGACFALELRPAAPERQELLPRSMRIRLADLQNVVADAVRPETRGAELASDLSMRREAARSARSQPPAAAAAAAAPEPLETVEWESVAGDSVIARRLTGVDIIVFRLFIAGDEVTGTAAAATASASPVALTGRRISCDSGF